MVNSVISSSVCQIASSSVGKGLKFHSTEYKIKMKRKYVLVQIDSTSDCHKNGYHWKTCNKIQTIFQHKCVSTEYPMIIKIWRYLFYSTCFIGMHKIQTNIVYLLGHKAHTMNIEASHRTVKFS